MSDIITWEPRVGSTGDDRYDWPPAEPLSQGGTSFSDPPTPAEVNAAEGLNQIIAEINRRQNYLGRAEIPYWPNTGPLTFAKLDEIKDSIEDIRDVESRTFQNISIAEPLTNLAIRNMRKFLSGDTTRMPLHRRNITKSGILRRQSDDEEYPPVGSISSANDPGTPLLGQEEQGGVVRYVIRRMYLNMDIYTQLPHTAAKFVIPFTSFRFGSTSTWNINCQYALDWGTLGTADWTWSTDGGVQDSSNGNVGSTTHEFDIDHAKLNPGGHNNWVFDSNKDGITAPNTNSGDRQSPGWKVTGDAYLEVTH